jgi:hypothetical protein
MGMIERGVWISNLDLVVSFVRIREYGRAMVPARILGGGGTVGSRAETLHMGDMSAIR